MARVALTDDNGALYGAPKTWLNTVVDQTQLYGLGPLYAGYALRTTQPVGIVALGSSTTGGEDRLPAERWVNKLIAQMQAAYPSGTGSESTVGTLTTTRRTTPGIHGYNGGLSGTTSADYLTDAKVAQVGGLQPRAITHMVGSNDYKYDMPPETYRANLVSWLDKLDAACPGPIVHILIHPHRRTDFTGPAYAYSEYRKVLRDLADTRANCVFIDVEQVFEAAGTTGSDPLGLLKSDLIHLEIPGHDMLYRVLARELGVAPTATAPAAAPAPTATAQTNTLFSDSFSGPDSTTLVGRAFDNYVGGSQARTWTGTAIEELGTSGGRLVRTTAVSAFFAGSSMDIPDYELAFTMSGLPQGHDLYVVVRRASSEVANSPNDYRLIIGTTGSWSVKLRNSGALSDVFTGTKSIVAGDRVSFRIKGSKLSVLINGVEAGAGTNTTLTAAGWVGFTGSGILTGISVDNLTVSAIL